MILPQNEIVGRSYRTDVLFGHDRCWVWAAIDPISKLLLAIEVGDRSLETLVPALQVQVWPSDWSTE